MKNNGIVKVSEERVTFPANGLVKPEKNPIFLKKANLQAPPSQKMIQYTSLVEA
jgi:hypothetical protein